MHEDDVVSADVRSDDEIDADIDAKLQAAARAAVANGEVDPDLPIAVAVDQDGNISVFNQDVETAETGRPDPVEFPPLYAEDHESETDRYSDHLATHWGF
jgi:hypothetical protein